MAGAGDSVSDCLEALQTCPLLNLEQSPQLLRNSMLHKSYKETMALWKSIKDGTYQPQRTAVEPSGVPTAAAAIEAAASAGAPSLQGPYAAVAAGHLQEEPPPAESPAMSAAMDRPRVRGRYRSRQRQRWACQEDKENAAAADAAAAAPAAEHKAAAATPSGTGLPAARGRAAGGNTTPLTGAGGNTAAAGAATGAAGSAGTPLTGFPANPSLGESWIRTTPLSGPLPEASATSTPSAAISAVTAAPEASAGVSSRRAQLPSGVAAQQQQEEDGAEAATPMSAGPPAAAADEHAVPLQAQPGTPEGLCGEVPGGGTPLPCTYTPGASAAAGGGPWAASPAPGDLPGDLLAQLSLVASRDVPGGVAEWFKGASNSSSSFPEGSVSDSLMQSVAAAAAVGSVAEGSAPIGKGRVPVGCSWFGDVGKWAWCGKEAATPIPASLAHTPQEMRERHLQSPDGSEQEEIHKDAEEEQQGQEQHLGQEEPQSSAEDCVTPPPAQPGLEAQQEMLHQTPTWQQQQQQQQLADEPEADGEEVAVSAAGFKGFWGAPHAPSSERYSSSSAVDTPGGVSQGSGSPQWNTPMLRGGGPVGGAALGSGGLQAAADGVSDSWEQGGTAAVTPGGQAALGQDPATPAAAGTAGGNPSGAVPGEEGGVDMQSGSFLAAGAAPRPPGFAQGLAGQQEGQVRQLHALLDTAGSFDAVSSSCSSSGDDWAAAERLQQQLKVSLAAAGVDVGAGGDEEGHRASPAGDVGDSLRSPGVLMSSPVPQGSSWAGKWGAYGSGGTPELTPTPAGAAGACRQAAHSSSSAARGVAQAGADVQPDSGGSKSMCASEGSGSGGRGGVEQQLQFSSGASSGGSSPVRKLHYQLHLSEEQEATPPPQTPAAAAAAGVAGGAITPKATHDRLPDPATSDRLGVGAATGSNSSASRDARRHASDRLLQEEVPASPAAEQGSAPMAESASSAEGVPASASTLSGPAGPLQGMLLDALGLEESMAVGHSLAGLLVAPAAEAPGAPASPQVCLETPLAVPGTGRGHAAASLRSPAEAAAEGVVSSPHSAVGGAVAGDTPLRLLLEQSLEFATPTPVQGLPAPATPEAAAAGVLGTPEASAGGACWQHVLGYTPGPAEAATPAGAAVSAAAEGVDTPTWGLRATPAGGATPASVPPPPAAGDQLASSSTLVGNMAMAQGSPAGTVDAEVMQGEELGASGVVHGRISPSSGAISEGHVKRLVQSGPWAPPVAAGGDHGDQEHAVLGQQVHEEDEEQAQQQQQQPHQQQQPVGVVEVGELPPPQQQQQDGEGAQLHQEEEEGSPLSFGQPTHHSQRSLAATAPPTPLPFGTMATVQPTSSSPEAASVQRPQQAAAGEEGAGAREGGRLLPAAVFGGIRIGKGATEQQLRNLLEQQQRRREQLLSSLLSASTSLSPGRAMKSLTPRLLIRHQQHLAGHPTAAAAAEAGGEQTPLAVRSRQGVAAAGGWQGGSATPGKSPGPSPCWSELSFQQGLAGRVYTPAAAGRGARGRGFLQRSLSLGDLSPFQASTNPAAAVTPEKGEAEGQRLDAALTLQDSPAPASASAARESAALPLSPVSPLAAALLGSGQLVRGISGGSVSSRRVSRDMQALDLSSSLELASNPLALAGLAEQLAAADADVMELQLMAAEAVRDATASRAERDAYAAACKDMQQKLRLLQEELNWSEADGQRCLLAMADLVDLAAEMPDASPGGPGGDQVDQSLPYLDVAALVQASSAGKAADSPARKAQGSGVTTVAAPTAASAAEQLELLVEQVEAQQQSLAQQNRHLQGLLEAAAASATPGAAPLTPQVPGTRASGLLLQQGEPVQGQAALLAQIMQEQQRMQQQVAETQQQLRALMQPQAPGDSHKVPGVCVATVSTQTHLDHAQQPAMVSLEQLQKAEAELQQQKDVNDELQEQLQASQQQVGDLEQQLGSLQEQVDAAQEVAAQTQQQLQAQLAAVEEQEEQQAETLQQAVQEVQRAQAGQQEAEAVAASMQQQLQQVQAQVEDLQLQLFKAEELAAQDQQQPSSGSGEQELDVLELKADIADLESELGAAQQQLEEGRDARQQLQQQLADAVAAREQLAQQLQEQQGQLVRYQHELQELRAAHDDISDQLTSQATDHLAAVRKQQDAAAALATALAEKQQLQEALLAQQAQTDSLSKMYQLLSGQQQHKRGGRPAAGVGAADSPSTSSGAVEGPEDEALGVQRPSSAAGAGQVAAAAGAAGLQQGAVPEETPRSRRLAASKGQLERRCHELLQENEQLRRGLSSVQQQLQETATSHQQEVDDLQEELQQLQGVCQQQVELLAEAQKQVVQLQEAHDRQAQRLVAAEQQLQKAVDEVQQAAAARLQQLQDAAQEQQAALEQSQQQVAGLQAACSLQKTQLAEAGVQLQKAQQEQQDRAAAAEAQLDQLRAVSDQQAQQLVAVQAQVQRQQEELAQQSAVLADTEALLQQVEEELHQERDQAAAIAQEQEEHLAEQHHQQLQQDRQHQEEQLAQAKERLVQMVALHQQMQGQLQSTQQQLEEAQAEAEEREQQLAEAQQQATEWEQHVGAQTGLLEEAKQQLQLLLEQNQQLAQAMQEQQQKELQDASAEEGERAALLRQQQQRYQELQQQHERVQQQLLEQQEEHAALAAGHAQAQQQLRKKQQQVVELKDALQRLVQQQEELQEAAEEARHQHNMARLEVAALAQQLEAQRVEAEQALAVHQADASQQLLAQQQAAAKQLAQQKAEAAQQLSACQQRLALCQELLQALQQQQLLREKQQEQQQQASRQDAQEGHGKVGSVDSRQGLVGSTAAADMQRVQQQLQQVTAEKQELVQELHQAKAVVEYLESCIRQLGRHNAELVAQLGPTPPAAAADTQAADLPLQQRQEQQADGTDRDQQDGAGQEQGGAKAGLSPALLARVLAAATRVHEKNKVLKQRLRQSGQP